MLCLGALAGVLGGWCVGIPIYVAEMSIAVPLHCLAGPVSCLTLPCSSGGTLAMSCVGGELAGIFSCLMGPCGPLAPAVTGLLGGVVGVVATTVCYPLNCISGCVTSFCGPCFLCSPGIGLCFALANIPVITAGGILDGLMGGSGPLLGLLGDWAGMAGVFECLGTVAGGLFLGGCVGMAGMFECLGTVAGGLFQGCGDAINGCCHTLTL